MWRTFFENLKILQHSLLHLILLSATRISQTQQLGELIQYCLLLWVFHTCVTPFSGRDGFYECSNYTHLREGFYTIIFGVVEGERTANQSQPLPDPGLGVYLPLTQNSPQHQMGEDTTAFWGHGLLRISEVILVIEINLKNCSYIRSNNRWRGSIFVNGSHQ